MAKTLEQRLLNYLRKAFLANPKLYIHKGHLETLAKQAGYLGETGGRELRRLCEKKLVESKKKGKSQEYRYCPNMEELGSVAHKLR